MRILDVMSAMRAVPELAKLRLDGRPVLDHLEDVAVVTTQGGSTGSANVAASRLLREPGMRQAIEGMLHHHRQRPGGEELEALLLPVGPAGSPLLLRADEDLWSDPDAPVWDRFAMSPRRDAYVAAKLVIAMDQLVAGAQPTDVAGFVRDNAPEFVAAWRPEALEAVRRDYLWSGQASRGVITAAPEVVDGWRALRAVGGSPTQPPAARRTAAETAFLFAHELEHTRSYPEVTDPRYDKLAWLEEGTATVLSEWRSEQGTMEQAMAVPAGEWETTTTGAYVPYVRVVRRLLEAAGIDEEQPGSRDAADALLQVPQLNEVPRALAAAVATNLGRGSDPGYIARLREAIERGRGSASHLRQIERVLGRA